MLTEIDHGLDTKHLETTATLQHDGSFILNTPHPGAAKYCSYPWVYVAVLYLTLD
jgi:alkylation response protein AidB-like acyl-CoA dehydrogenase